MSESESESDVRRAWQSGDITVVAGDRWAIVREQPIGEDAVSQFFVRERYWTPLMSVGRGQVWADPDTIFDLAVSLRAMRVYDVNIVVRMICTAQEMQEVLAGSPDDAPIEVLDWDGKSVYRTWWTVRGTVVTVLLVDEVKNEHQGHSRNHKNHRS